MESIRIVLMTLIMAFTILHSGEGQLVENFYISTCPNVELIVSQAVTNKFTQTITTGQATLRLFLHDCFVEVYIFSIIHNFLSFLIICIYIQVFFIKEKCFLWFNFLIPRSYCFLLLLLE